MKKRSMWPTILLLGASLSLTMACPGPEDETDAGVVADATVGVDSAVEEDAAVEEDSAVAVTTGAISGTITSSVDNAALVGATVTTDPATVSATTDSSGMYTLDEIEAGTYSVIVNLDGYTEKTRAGVTVTAEATTTLDLIMDPATGDVTLTVVDLCSETGSAGLVGATVSRSDASDALTGTDGLLAIDDVQPGDVTLDVNMAGYLPMSATVTVVAGDTATASIDMTCQSLVVAERARTMLTTEMNGDNRILAFATTAMALHDNMNDGDDTNTPTVVSVRSAEHYAAGHVPGAINIGWKAVADDASLTTLDSYGADAQYVGYCYTGHTGGIASASMYMMGYPTANMKFGVASWNRDTFSAYISDYSADYPIETTVNTTTATYEKPWLEFPEATTVFDTVKLAVRSYLSDPDMAPVISGAALNTLLTDGDDSNDPFIISVRAAAAYESGHIPGAINIPWTTIADDENLAKIPTDRDIVVYCYTGHTGAVVTAVLGALGYHRVTNLKFGFNGYSSNTDAGASGTFDVDANTNLFDVEVSN